MADIINSFESERPIKQKPKSSVYYKTGSTLVDLLVGGGMSMGYPGGRIINLVGEAGAGKTFFACEIIAAARRQYKDKFHWVYDDAERGFSFDGKVLWGFDIIPEDAVQSETVEDLYYNVRNFLRKLKDDEHGIYVVDSLDALSNAELEERAEARMRAGDKGENFDKGTFGASSQKFLSQEFFRKLAAELEAHNSLLIFVSQLRDNLNAGMFGEKRRKSGGSALDFYCDTIVELRTKEKFEKKGLTVGVCVEAKLKKSKTGRPFRSALVNVLFDYGIDDVSTNIDFLYDFKSDVTGKLGTNLVCNMGDTSDPRYGKYADNLEGLKSVLEDEELLDECKEYLRVQGKKFNRATVYEWLQSERNDIFSAYYGKPYTREKLIEAAVTDKILRKSLRERAVDKWESREREVATGRCKYMEDDDE